MSDARIQKGGRTAVSGVLDETIHFELLLRRTVGTLVRADKQTKRAEETNPTCRDAWAVVAHEATRVTLVSTRQPINVLRPQFFFPALGLASTITEELLSRITQEKPVSMRTFFHNIFAQLRGG